MCSPQLSVLHWINNCWYQKFTLEISTLSLPFKNYSIVEVACWLDSIRLRSSREIQRILIKNSLNKKNTHIHTKHSMEGNTGKG